ncbi:unnamed protein product [Withania somnifera]
MAYAAITSLMRTIDQSMQLTGCDLQSFYEKFESLRATLEKHWNITDHLEALTSLEAKIIELACSTEDLVDIEARKIFLAKNEIMRKMEFWELCFVLKQSLENIDSAMSKWMSTRLDVDNMKPRNLALSDAFEYVSEPDVDMMVGHENEFDMMQERLARGASELEILSIVGMGGIGKTTLANKIYSDPFIMSRFDVRAKATVSQGYCARVVLIGLLSCISGKADGSHAQQDDGELADRLQKLLKGRRYLVIIDDIWNKGDWDDIKLCLPDSNCGSKPPYRMRLMNFDESWSLLCGKVFEKEWGGLPLVIIVIAGLLSKIGITLKEWKGVAENVSSMVSADLDARCLRVLALSYHHLPHHLKACFLYFAIFPEDEAIVTKSIKEIAEKCLKDLIDRSLIASGRIHDVTREFCLKEARNMKFLNEDGGKNDQTDNINERISRGRINIQNGKELASCGNSEERAIFLFYRYGIRVLDLALMRCFTFPSWILDLIHLRYLALTLSPGYVPSPSLDIPPSISSLHYLQTFILKVSHHEASRYSFILPSDILTIPQQSHLCLDWNYLHDRKSTEKCLVLKNLHSLYGWNPLFCTWSVFRLLPNLKNLQIRGIQEDFRCSQDILYFRYLDQLEELEFHIATPQHNATPANHVPPLLLPSPGAFPQNLKNLTFSGTSLLWKNFEHCW